MRALRRCARFAFVFAASLVLVPGEIVARLLECFGSGRLGLRTAARVQQLWSRCMLFGMGVEVVLENELPPGVHLVVANHLSYVDIPALGALFPARFVAKREIASWPLLGPLTRVAGTIFVLQRRSREVLRVDREIERTLAAGVSVVLFPEGGSSRGVRVERLHSALLDSAARRGFPCLPIALSYETPLDPWAPAATVCWWGGMGFFHHAVGLASLHRIRCLVSPGSRALAGSDRKELCRGLQAELAARFRPVRQTPLPPDFPWPELFRDPGPHEGSEAPP